MDAGYAEVSKDKVESLIPLKYIPIAGMPQIQTDSVLGRYRGESVLGAEEIVFVTVVADIYIISSQTISDDGFCVSSESQSEIQNVDRTVTRRGSHELSPLGIEQADDWSEEDAGVQEGRV